MAAGVLILVGFAIMGWSALGLINPVRFAEGSRGRAFGVGVIGFALFMVGGSMLPPTPETTSTATSSPTPTSAPAVSGEIVHPESDFHDEVAAFLSQGVARAHVQSDDLLQARAYNNDLVLTFSSDFSAILGASDCDNQRDLAASFWLQWVEHAPNRSGAGVTFQSPTGHVLASAEQGLSGAVFHCE